MQMEIRKAEDRGASDLGWLDSRHTFSFAHYVDPDFMGFGMLRVINDDRIKPGQGFPTHPHQDMEIISYILDGALAHRDSMGNVSIIEKGEVQRMSAGTGIFHSEFNASDRDTVHFLQIWVLPYRRSLRPGYEQARFEDADKRGVFRLIGSPDGRDGSLTIHSGLDLYATRLEEGETAHKLLHPGTKAWIHVATGEVVVNGRSMSAGDGASIVNADFLTLNGRNKSEILSFVMAI